VAHLRTGGRGRGAAPNLRLSPRNAEALYRIVHEALSNVVKHAWARRAGIVVTPREGGVGVRIADNGVEFPVERPAVDALGMRDRVHALGGTAQVGNRSTGGASVCADRPVSSGQDA
jgi:signal transduction histidine kinase